VSERKTVFISKNVCGDSQILFQQNITLRFWDKIWKRYRAIIWMCN